MTIYWGDGSTPTPATVDQATHTFTATHVYTAPSSVEAGKGLYAVTATLTDSEGLSTTIGGGKLYAEVDDVPPTGLALGFTSETVAPGGAVSLSGQFQRPRMPTTSTMWPSTGATARPRRRSVCWAEPHRSRA